MASMSCEFSQTGHIAWHCDIHDRTVVQRSEPNYCYPVGGPEPRIVLPAGPSCRFCADPSCDGDCAAAMDDLDARAAYWQEREVA